MPNWPYIDKKPEKFCGEKTLQSCARSHWSTPLQPHPKNRPGGGERQLVKTAKYVPQHLIIVFQASNFVVGLTFAHSWEKKCILCIATESVCSIWLQAEDRDSIVQWNITWGPANLKILIPKSCASGQEFTYCSDYRGTGIRNMLEISV